ncbi:TetR/AcrR family transcriptional regulator [Gordonia sp. NPDC003429]
MPGVNERGARTRGYDNSARRENARATRRRIVSAATSVVERDGYTATVADIARAADVSPETIYKNFGGKAGLIKEAFDQAIAGDDVPVPMADRPESGAIDEEPDLDEKIRMYARLATGRAARSSRLMLAIRDGVARDPALADLYDDLLRQRLAGMTALATTLLSTGPARAAVTVERLRDALWALISPEIYDMLVGQRGWSDDDYREWLIRAIHAEVV